jgi:hypothetical protein
MHVIEARRAIRLAKEELQRAAGDCNCRNNKETGSDDDLAEQKGAGVVHCVPLPAAGLLRWIAYRVI